MNTTDQAFIRAYGSDFVPSYADEAARAADYSALADSNVNAVFGSRPRQHYRVDGPSATPTTAVSQVAGGSLPAPMPARPYVPQPAQVPPAPLPSPSATQGPTVGRQYPPAAPSPVRQTIQPLPIENEADDIARAVQLESVQQPVDSVQPLESVQQPLESVIEPAATVQTPLAPHVRVPRPHINFAAVAAAQSQPADIDADLELQEEPQQEPQQTPSSAVLNAEDGLAVLADSSVLIGSSVFEWPTIEPAVAEAPTVAGSTPEASLDEPTAEAAEVVGPASDAEASVTPPIARDVRAEEPSEAPLSPAIANVDKDAAGAEMAAESDEPVAVRQKLKPAWEVDRLLWPADADQLYESESEYFRHAGEKLRDASQEGLRVLGISSSHDGEGCTTLAICLARAAAASGAKVALLDANLRSPQLGSALGLDFARSWHETLDGATPLAEAAVTAIADNVTLIPLSQNAARQGVTLDSDAFSELLDQARKTFDLVLVDLGSSCDEGQNCLQTGEACPLDAAIVVRDVRTTSEEETLESVSRFRTMGIDAVGVAENFAASAVAQAAA